MSTEALLQEIQSHYLRLQQAEADARYWYAHYLDELQARYRQQLQEIGAAFWGQGDQAPAEGQEAPASSKTAAAATEMHPALRWVISPWDDEAWARYRPAPDALIPSAVRVGRLVLPDGAAPGDLPALAPLVGERHLFLEGDDPDATRQLLQTLLLRPVVSCPQHRYGGHPRARGCRLAVAGKRHPPGRVHSPSAKGVKR